MPSKAEVGLRISRTRGLYQFIAFQLGYVLGELGFYILLPTFLPDVYALPPPLVRGTFNTRILDEKSCGRFLTIVFNLASWDIKCLHPQAT